MRQRIKILLSIVFLGMVLILPSENVQAAGACGGFGDSFIIHSATGTPNAIAGLPAFCTAASVATVAINLLLAMSGAVAVIFLMLGGFWYLTAAGNEEMAEKGRKALTNSIIGLVIIIMSFAVVRIAINLLTSATGGGSGTPAASTSNPPAGTTPAGGTNSPAGNGAGSAFANPMFAGITSTDVNNYKNSSNQVNYLAQNIVITPKNPGLLVNSTISPGETSLLTQIAMICGDVSSIPFNVKVNGVDYMQSNYTKNGSDWVVIMASAQPIQPGQSVETFVCNQSTNKNLAYPSPGASPR